MSPATSGLGGLIAGMRIDSATIINRGLIQRNPLKVGWIDTLIKASLFIMATQRHW